MKPYKRMSKGALTMFVVSLMTAGGAATVGTQAFAQTSSPATTSVTKSESQSMGDVSKHQRRSRGKKVALPSGAITEAQARAAIAVKYPGTVINRVKLENEGGVIVYDAKLADKTEVNVDVITSVVAQETAEQEAAEHSSRTSLHRGFHKAGGTSADCGPVANEAETAN